jgi:hypothetical protein
LRKSIPICDRFLKAPPVNLLQDLGTLEILCPRRTIYISSAYGKLYVSMINGYEEEYLLRRAYVPEHIVSLMVLISRAEPFLINDFICYLKDDWLIVVGYPLEGEFSGDRFDALLHKVALRFKPHSLWMAAPDVPDPYRKSAKDIERDAYYKLDLDGFEPKTRLAREVNKAAEYLRVERAARFTKEHAKMINEFIKREKPSSRVEHLYLSMEDYTSKSGTAVLLDARDRRGRLSAFYVVELAAREFAAHIVGCHSKTNYVPHASDLLFYEMVSMAGKSGKSYVNLGLGVNEGIRRFKEKWGGRPYLEYTFCDYQAAPKNLGRSFASIIDAMKRL